MSVVPPGRISLILEAGSIDPGIAGKHGHHITGCHAYGLASEPMWAR